MKIFGLKWFLLIIILASIAYISGLVFIDLFEEDACQYANIAMEMLQRKSFFEIYHFGNNYLDKPPLLFWLSAISYLLFGISDVAYRLPSFLFTILGLYSAYKLAASLYTRNTGIVALIILLSCQAYFIFNHDVRTDTLLTASVIFAIWQLYEYIHHQKIKNLIFGFTGIGLAMLSKGPIGAIVPLLAFVPDVIYRGRWKVILKWHWLFGIMIVLLILTPMLIGLYRQYGMHGIRFYFWEQSFGRITGENVWDNNPDPFFLYHSFLWAFAPWSLLAVYAVFERCKKIFREIKYRQPKTEIFTLCGIVFPFISLSLSNFQLPHYIFVLFPLFAVIRAGVIEKMIVAMPRTFNVFHYIQFGISVIVIILTLTFFTYFFPVKNIFLWLLWAIAIIFALIAFFGNKIESARIIIPSALTVIGLNILLNLHFYPDLSKLQAGGTIARLIKEKNIPIEHVHYYYCSDQSMVFYSGKMLQKLNDDNIIDSLANQKKIWLYSTPEGYRLFLNSFIPAKVYIVDHNHATLLTFRFLNPKTRKSSLDKRYLIEL